MPAEAPESAIAVRLENWKRKLLDLTLRNRLLNHRATKSEIPLVCPNMDALAELLCGGKKMSFVAALDEPGSGASTNELPAAAGKESAAKGALENLSNGRLTAFLDDADMVARLIGLYRSARTQLQEGGANTLYVALGYLEWCRPGDREHKYLAPLLMIPVTLYRTSVRAGVKLTSSDEDPILNPTLLQMLRQDFRMEISGLSEDDLPEGSAGMDFSKIFRLVNRAVAARDFKIVNKVVLSTFSFAKHLMWKELVDREDMLRKNSIVKHLIETPNEPYLSDKDFADESKLDDEFHVNELLTPFSSDSSQLACIASADRGKSFVLQGPPGTGKSQTIANMIAHMMGKGKKVLFVSEKMAALNVVHQRLSSIGLGKFCLELHSNKASKQAVMQQLRAADDLRAELRNRQSTKNRTGERVMQIRNGLNSYVRSVHTNHPSGVSIYEAFGHAVRDIDSEALEIAWQDIDVSSVEEIDHIRNVARELADRIGDVRDLLHTPLTCIEKAEWSYGWASEILSAADTALAASASCRKAAQSTAELLGYELAPAGMAELEALQRMVRILPGEPDTSMARHFGLMSGINLQALLQAIELFREYGTLTTRMSSTYSVEEIAKLAEVQTIRRKRLSEGKSGPLKTVMRLSWRVHDRYMLKGRGVVDIDEELRLIECTHEILVKLRPIEKMLQPFSLWKGLASDIDALSRLAQLEHEFRDSVQFFANRSSMVESVRQGLAAALEGYISSTGDGKTKLEEFQEFSTECDEFKLALSKLAEQAASTSLDLQLRAAHDVFNAAQAATVAIKEHENRLHEWCSWQHARRGAAGLGLEESLYGMLGDGELTPEVFADRVMSSYYRWWLKPTLDKDPVLRQFSPRRHEDMISEYRALDKSFCRETAEHIAIEISKASESGDGSSVLRREFQKKRRHLPVRQLMSRCGGVVSRLTPCFLMSPLSIAQYLPIDFDLFDVVIFDEASQIPVWDAVGAIARGKQVIVAGDDKQLPPTTFFDRSDTDPTGEDEQIEELESILKEMLAAGIPSQYLRWHYRSRHESLIAFSNRKYYENRLLTFPSAVTSDKAVRSIFVGGVYDRGRSRTNRTEAARVVEDVLARLRSAHAAGVEPSIGVITFNSQQQNDIENLLDIACANFPDLERYFLDGVINEPVFVKTLETVQGDERDVILLSTAYGPDKKGRMPMNFGPLGYLGGERRLNVAVTRAREEMTVYTSLKPEMIDVSKVSHDGVPDLRDYLLYAAGGVRAIASTDDGSTGDFESDFEREVARRLAAKGWKLRTQVGVARYRIDLGVVHPKDPGRFMCGIECDGATYHSAPTARDRDMLREQELRKLGWKLVRVWSTAFFRLPDRTIEKVHQELEQILKNDGMS